MKRLCLSCGTLLCILTVSAGLFALDELSGSMKQILDRRANDFASIRKEPFTVGDDTNYKSTLLVAGAMGCYITPVARSVYSDSCDIIETKDRATLTTKYKRYVKALHDASPASWMSWTENTAKPASEATYFGPDRSHPAAAVRWDLGGMNMDWYNLAVTFYASGYTMTKQQ